MHKPAIAPLVFSRLFPSSQPSDPIDLRAHISRNIIPEVRSETVCFYGPINCLESQYPGLDYANPAHRIRLGRFPWHRRLFRVFDELRLSEHEIQSLCKWEGTRWARERYEKEEGVKIRDTTWDDIAMAIHANPTATRNVPSEVDGAGDDLDAGRSGAENRGEMAPMSEITDLSESISDEEEDGEEDDDDEAEDEEEEGGEEGEEGGEGGEEEGEEEDEDEDEEEGVQGYAAEEESEDELQQSVGLELNQRLLVATEARARGEEVVLDEDWEQWLKETAERVGRGVVAEFLRNNGQAP